MWVDGVLLVAISALFLLMIEASYKLGKDRGYDDGYQAAVDLQYVTPLELVAPWEHRPAVRDRDA